MGTFFMGSTGSAEAFRRGENGLPELMFTSKTLMETGLSFNIQKEQIRGGEGASIQFEFYHSPSVDISLVDAIFKTDYIETQLGTEFSEVGEEDNESYQTETVTFTDGVGYLSKAVRPLPIACDSGEQYVAWGCAVGDDEWYMLDVDSTNRAKVTLPDASGKYCVSYLAEDMSARVAEVTSQIVPEEFFLIITVPLFAGNPCEASQGKSAGYVQFEIPRFSPTGAMEFSMNASEFSPTRIDGQALAAPGLVDGEDKDVLMRIIEVVFGRSWTDDIINLYLDPDTAYVGETPIFYAQLKTGESIKLSLADVVYRRDQTSDYTYNVPEDYTFPSAGDYWFNIYLAVKLVADGEDFLSLSTDATAQETFRVVTGGILLKSDRKFTIEASQDLSSLYYNDDIYFM